MEIHVMGVAKESLKTAMKFTPGGRIALEAGKFIGPEGRTRRRVVGSTMLLGGGAVVGALVLAPMNAPDEKHVMSMDAGSATVTDIDRYLAEMHVVGFQTEVDGTWVENRETDRKALGLPLPDITHELVVNDRIIDSTLCITGGNKNMTEAMVNGVKHVEYILNPEDISVCSAESPDSLALSIEDGNWITNINDADKNLKKLGRDAKSDRSEWETEEDQLRGRMAQVAKNLAIRAVNQQCAPKVFEVTKDDVLQRIEDMLGRDGEVFTAKYPEDISTVSISGQSEMDTFFEELPNKQFEGKKVEYEVKGMGECKLSPELAAKSANQTNDNAVTASKE